MTATRPRGERRQEILETLVSMLEAGSAEKITTASLAARIGVSEAALYRHFPSKARMYDGLLDFVEEALFSRIATIIDTEQSALEQIPRIINLVLAFAENNPGISRIMTGHALIGEDPRLETRNAQIFSRIETQLRQIVREADHREGLRTPYGQAVSVNLCSAFMEGKLLQFVRSGFRQKPTENWQEQWTALSKSLFRLHMSTPDER